VTVIAAGAPLSHPLGMMTSMEEPVSFTFAAAARVLGFEARRRGLAVPAFRSPPRASGVSRSLRRGPRGALVSVQVRGRPWAAVLGDMVEGVVVANGLEGADAQAARSHLWGALTADARVGAAVEAA